MKELIFRAWHIKSCKMVHAPTFKGVMNTNYPGYHIMQYTGLNDKNKTPVYEGDIVCLYDNEGAPMYYNIEWKPDCYMMVGDGGPGEWLTLEEFEGCTIVGNKYENPELNPRQSI